VPRPGQLLRLLRHLTAPAAAARAVAVEFPAAAAAAALLLLCCGLQEREGAGERPLEGSILAYYGMCPEASHMSRHGMYPDHQCFTATATHC
jgi:hypothetical protein